MTGKILSGSFKRTGVYSMCVIGALVGLFIFILVASGVAVAQSCDNIRDQDQRYYCRAMKGDKNACMYIRNVDIRHSCEAVFKR